MRHFPLRLVGAVLAGTWLLAACGGSSSQPGGAAAWCELPLAYANGSSGGNRIEPLAQTVPRQFNPCPIRQVQSLTVGLCLGHQQISELSAQLVYPNGSTQSLNLPGASSAGACLVGGQLWQTTLSTGHLQSLQNLEGHWSLRVSDDNQVSSTPVGALVGWSMRAQGQP